RRPAEDPNLLDRQYRTHRPDLPRCVPPGADDTVNAALRSAEDPRSDAGGRGRPGVHDQVVGDDPCQLHLPAVAVVDEELLFHRVVEHPWAGLRDGSVVTYRVDAERGAV